jgi:hypothetical protein
MIVLVMGSALYMIAAQASMAAPTNAFKDCLRQTSAKAKTEKVAATAYEAYARSACGGQLNALTNAIAAFNVKNGMSKKAATSDAALTAGDYLSSSVEKYEYLAGVDAENSKATAAAAPAPVAASAATPTVQPTPASAPKPKP